MNKVKLLLGIMFATVILLNPKKIWAQESYGYEVLTETEDAGDEKEISLTVKLTDYKKAKSGIRAIQIDISDKDNLLKNAIYASSIEDKKAFINEVKYQDKKKIIRQLYIKRDGILPYDTSDLLQVMIHIPDENADIKSINLEMRILIQNMDGDKLTYKSIINVNDTNIKGDVNTDGQIDVQDLRLIIRYLCEKQEFNKKQLNLADVNEDQSVDIQDLRKLLRFVCGKEASLD